MPAGAGGSEYRLAPSHPHELKIREIRMTSYEEIVEGARPWQGVLDTSILADAFVRVGHRLADAAKAGNWPEVMNVLDQESDWLVINQWRPGGAAWFTVLHPAAWHGAPTEVLAELINRGALRSLRDSKARRAFDVAVEHQQTRVLLELLQPPRAPLTQGQVEALDAQLATVIDGRIRGRLYDGNLRKVLRYPPVEILYELPGQRVWFPMPATYGFHIALQGVALEVKSWCGLVEGSGQIHLVTPEGSVMVDQGFV
jgi:hypothetical protein